MDLADRRGGDRRLLELGEELGDRELEILLDHALDVLVRERADVVLECLQLEQDVRRNDVGARREELAELDERRAELVEQLAQVLAALGARAFEDARAGEPRRQEVGQAVGLEEIAEAVLDGDLCDLRDPSEIAGRGARGHRISLPRRPGLARRGKASG